MTRQLEEWLSDAEKTKKDALERLDAPSAAWRKKVTLLEGKLGEQQRAIQKKLANATQVATHIARSMHALLLHCVHSSH